MDSSQLHAMIRQEVRMKQLHLRIGLMVWLLAVGFSVPAVAQQQDDAAIRQVQVLQAAAWNRHDARAYANLFAEDGDAVNIVGFGGGVARRLSARSAKASNSSLPKAR